MISFALFAISITFCNLRRTSAQSVLLVAWSVRWHSAQNAIPVLLFKMESVHVLWEKVQIRPQILVRTAKFPIAEIAVWTSHHAQIVTVDYIMSVDRLGAEHVLTLIVFLVNRTTKYAIIVIYSLESFQAFANLVYKLIVSPVMVMSHYASNVPLDCYWLTTIVAHVRTIIMLVSNASEQISAQLVNQAT